MIRVRLRLMADGPVHIEVRLQRLAQLFNSMDSSPFSERDLDADAEEFIVSWAQEAGKSREVELIVHLTEPPPPDRAAALEETVRHFFRERAQMKHLEFRQLLRRGRWSLLIGLSFLSICLTFGKIIGSFDHGAAAQIVTEGLTIVGWVAMWHPLEIHLYEWWPLRDEWLVLERLARATVRLVLPSPA